MFRLPCCVNCTTAAGSFVETATGVAPTDGIFISASGGDALPLVVSNKLLLLLVDNAPPALPVVVVVVVAAGPVDIVVAPLRLGLNAAGDVLAAVAVVMLPSFVGN